MATYQQRIARYYKAGVKEILSSWAGAAPTDYDWTAVDSFSKSDPATYIWFDEATITEAIFFVASSTPFNRLVAKGKASFPSGREEGASPIKVKGRGYFTRLATELTQGSRKERASRQLRQQKVELRNTEEKRIQLNLSLRAVQIRESKVNGQWRIYPSLPRIHLKPTDMPRWHPAREQEKEMVSVLLQVTPLSPR